MYYRTTNSEMFYSMFLHRKTRTTLDCVSLRHRHLHALCKLTYFSNKSQERSPQKCKQNEKELEVPCLLLSGLELFSLQIGAIAAMDVIKS